MDKFEELIARIQYVIQAIKSNDKHISSVCICGSSRFADIEAVVKWELEKASIMATGLHLLPQWYIQKAKWEEDHHGAEQENVARVMDSIHLRKIALYDSVLVVNVGGYIGERTSLEIGYAFQAQKPIFFLEKNEEEPVKIGVVLSVLGNSSSIKVEYTDDSDLYLTAKRQEVIQDRLYCYHRGCKKHIKGTENGNRMFKVADGNGGQTINLTKEIYFCGFHYDIHVNHKKKL